MAHNFLSILQQLRNADVQFVVVGGVAAALHGGSRVTFDLDLVPSLEPNSWQVAIDLLWDLGARPRIPETRERIRDPDNVRVWREEKGMLALNFRTNDGALDIDLLVSESDRFDDLKERAISLDYLGQRFAVASIDDLIEMKSRAGRPQDLLDIAELRALQASDPIHPPRT
jgi:predicted nucleotidyltransferase